MNIKFELINNNLIVGYEEHKESSYYNKPQIRIFHSKINGPVWWDIKEWPEKFIGHDKKRCLHENTSSAGGVAQCKDCGYEVW